MASNPRRPDGSSSGGPSSSSVPAPEVSERPTRRRFTAEYKLSILEQADACSAPGEIGALLRREGLYSSILSFWRRQRDEGALGALRPKKRGPRPKAVNPLARRVEELEREKRRLARKLEEAHAVIAVQKKLSEILARGATDSSESEET